MIKLLHCGPIQYNGRITHFTDEGPEIQKDHSLIPTLKPEPWVAEWIWLDPEEFDEFQMTAVGNEAKIPIGTRAVAFFRKEFNILDKPKEGIAWVSGDSKYRLYINGQMVGRGPAELGGDFTYKVSPAWWFYESYDLTPYLHQGINVVTAEVVLYPEVGADYSTGHGGFIFEAHLCGQNSSDSTSNIQIIKSDDTWKANLGESYLVKSIYDSRLEPIDWHTIGFDDSEWLPSKVLAPEIQRKWHLIPREIPHLMEIQYPGKDVTILDIDDSTRIHNLHAMIKPDSTVTVIKPGTACKIRIEFDREVAGYFQYSLTACAGVELHWDFFEKIGTKPESDIFITRDGQNTFESIRLRGFQLIELTIDFKHGTDNSRPLEILFIGMNFTSFPIVNRGSFKCSEENLNQIWKVGRYTNQLCMQNYHLDSPIHQEPLSDPGDYLIEALISYYAFGEYRLARQDILRIVYLLRDNNYFMFHTSYELLWIQMVVDYFQFTGDLDLIRSVILDIDRLLERFHGYIGQTGIISEAPNYMFMDWIKVDGYELHHPPSSIGQGYMTAFYYQALQNGIYLAEFTQHPELITKFQTRLGNVGEAFQRNLWDPIRKLYKDGIPGLTHVAPNQWMPADPDKIYYSCQTNILALAYGLVPEEMQIEIMREIITNTDFPPVQPYFMHFLFDALKKTHLFNEYGLEQIRKWIPNLIEHPTSWKESWNFGDYSHAWSGTPTIQLSAQVLGISPMTPGFMEVNIRPQPGNLQWAKGTIPTKLGDIHVSWEQSENSFEIEIQLPAKMKGIYYIPPLSFQPQTILMENQSPILPIKEGIEIQEGRSKIKVKRDPIL